MKHKVFIIIDHLGEGGAQRQVIEYLKQADKARFDFMVVSLDATYNTVGREISELGIKIVEIEHRGLFNLVTVNRLAGLFRNERPDIVFTYLFTADSYGRLAARIAGVPVIICAMRAVDQWKKWHHIFADWALTHFTDAVTINAERIRPFLVTNEKFPEAKIRTIYNGVDLRRFEGLRPAQDVRNKLGIAPEVLLVCMVGRFDKQKDFPTFFKASKNIIARGANAVILAVGAGPFFEESKKEVEWDDTLKNRAIFTGVRRDALDFINASDICVLSSHYEGCPNVILEYMACSKPVVASDVGGCAELVIEGETGFIVPHADEAALADRLLRLLKDKDLRERMGRAGRKRVEENFTSEIMARKTEALFEELLSAKNAGRKTKGEKT